MQIGIGYSPMRQHAEVPINVFHLKTLGGSGEAILVASFFDELDSQIVKHMTTPVNSATHDNQTSSLSHKRVCNYGN